MAAEGKFKAGADDVVEVVAGCWLPKEKVDDAAGLTSAAAGAGAVAGVAEKENPLVAGAAGVAEGAPAVAVAAG